jgi:hypothetical protein
MRHSRRAGRFLAVITRGRLSGACQNLDCFTCTGLRWCSHWCHRD